MGSILAIAKYTVIEQIRNRLYLIILFFGGALLVSSLLLGALAPNHKIRVVFDLGLLALELFGLVTAVFGAVSLILQEMESKTIYLLLTRPLNRAYYVLGRFLGLMVAVVLTMSVMAFLHVLILWTDPYWFRDFISGWSFSAIYPTLILMSMAKILITAAIAIFFSLFATSSVSALVFTVCFWVAGHFGPELLYLINTSIRKPLRPLVHTVSYLLPNFQYLNFRDSYAIPGFPGFQFIGWALLYSVGYAAFFLILASILFSKREF